MSARRAPRAPLGFSELSTVDDNETVGYDSAAVTETHR